MFIFIFLQCQNFVPAGEISENFILKKLINMVSEYWKKIEK